MEEDIEQNVIVEVQHRTEGAYAAKLVITRRNDDGSAGGDPSRRIERHVTEKKALGLAIDLLRKCDVPEDVIQRLETLKLSASTRR
jgi:hypothetical protein